MTGTPRILLTTDAVGGVWRYSLELAAGFLVKGAQVVLAGMGRPAGPAQLVAARRIAGLEYVETGLPLDWLAEDPDELRTASHCLADLAERVGADTVQLHAPALAADAAWPAPVIVVAHSCVGTWWRAVRHGPLPPTLAWRAHATARGLAAADAILVPSRAFGHALQSIYGPGFSPLVVHNGSSFRQCRTTARQSFLTAGRLWDDGKNIAALDHAAHVTGCPAFAHRGGPTAKLPLRPRGAERVGVRWGTHRGLYGSIIIARQRWLRTAVGVGSAGGFPTSPRPSPPHWGGEGERRIQIRAAGPVSGPDGTRFTARNLLLLGELDQAAMAREYAQAAVFVSPALYEPFGLAVLEAAQSGCALLLSGIPSFRELWNGAALFFDPRDPAELARCLLRLRTDDILIRNLGLAARRRAARYSAARMIARTWAVHRRLQPPRRMAA